MVKLVMREKMDLENAYRTLLGKAFWALFGFIALLQLLASAPLYLMGHKYYLLPVVFGCLPLLLVYWLMTRKLEEDLETAPPEYFYPSLVIGGLVLGAFSFFTNESALEEISTVENVAQTDLIQLATFLHQFQEDARDSEEIVSINDDWNDPEFFPEMPKRFRGHLNWVPLGQEAAPTKPSLNGYNIYYRCSTLSLWFLWSVPANYPDGGQRSWLLDMNGTLLARDFYNEDYTIKQFPVHRRHLKNYKKISQISFTLRAEQVE